VLNPTHIYKPLKPGSLFVTPYNSCHNLHLPSLPKLDRISQGYSTKHPSIEQLQQLTHQPKHSNDKDTATSTVLPSQLFQILIKRQTRSKASWYVYTHYTHKHPVLLVYCALLYCPFLRLLTSFRITSLRSAASHCCKYLFGVLDFARPRTRRRRTFLQQLCEVW
jgi:hypothetical protein